MQSPLVLLLRANHSTLTPSAVQSGAPIRTFSRSPLLVFLALLLTLSFSACKPADKPNEVLIITDEGIMTEQVLAPQPTDVAQQTETGYTSTTTISHSSNPQPLTLFEQTISRPEWFANEEVLSINTSQEVSALWQSKKRCCIDKKTLRENNREFYRACYQAIVKHYDDDELVVKCLWLMDAGLSGAEQTAFNRFLLDNYPNHQNNISRCASCSTGDTVARVTRELAMRTNHQALLGKAASLDEAISLIEDLLDRRNDISLWVQLEIHETLGRFYLEQVTQLERDINQQQQQRFLAMDQTLAELAASEKLADWRVKNYHKIHDRVLSR